MHTEILRMAASTILSWPLSGHEKMAGEAAATTLLRAEVGGVLGHATPEQRERIQGVLQSMSFWVREIDVLDVFTLGHWRGGGQPHHFMRVPGRTAKDSVRIAIDALWNNVNDAVFQFRWEAPYVRECLGQALHALQDSFSPAHVKRVKSEDGIFVIKDVFDYTAQDSKEHEKGDETYKTGEAGESPLSELGKAAVLASQLLLSHFVQRVLNLTSEAAQSRQTLEKSYLREETE